MDRQGITNDNRRGALRYLLEKKHCLRFMEVHNPISALIAENTKINSFGELIEYDGFWSSSLTDSTTRGKPDIEALDIPNRLLNVNDVFEVTTKPLIFDGDTGGKAEHFAINIRSLERAGVSAVIIEDKTGLKKNSLLGNRVVQHQASIPDFCNKIKIGKLSQISRNFMIIARVESLILERGMEDALNRAFAYVDSGADGIMIHSQKKDPSEVLKFANSFKAKYPEIALICVPTSYSQIYFNELENSGFNIVIYANHLFRSAYPAMQDVAQSILRHGRTFEVESQCLKIQDILELIPGTK